MKQSAIPRDNRWRARFALGKAGSDTPACTADNPTQNLTRKEEKKCPRTKQTNQSRISKQISVKSDT
jgi:hypothetical protein